VKVREGEPIPGWVMDGVSAARMRTVAAILRDPNPVHWDRAATARLGLGDRVVNQSPINLSYIQNMLMAWAGPSCIKRLRVRFPGVVFEGDRMTAGGVVRSCEVADRPSAVECEVWLEHEDGTRAVEGTAIVELPIEDTLA
jgi:acyl dehydratase